MDMTIVLYIHLDLLMQNSFEDTPNVNEINTLFSKITYVCYVPLQGN